MGERLSQVRGKGNWRPWGVFYRGFHLTLYLFMSRWQRELEWSLSWRVCSSKCTSKGLCTWWARSRGVWPWGVEVTRSLGSNSSISDSSSMVGGASPGCSGRQHWRLRPAGRALSPRFLPTRRSVAECCGSACQRRSLRRGSWSGICSVQALGHKINQLIQCQINTQD